MAEVLEGGGVAVACFEGRLLESEFAPQTEPAANPGLVEPCLVSAPGQFFRDQVASRHRAICASLDEVSRCDF